MRPLTAITGILLGSCLSIAVSLAAILLVYLILSDEYPRLQHEFRPLTHSVLIFFGLTTIAGASFYSLIKNHRAWIWAQCVMWLGLAATAWYYLP